MIKLLTTRVLFVVASIICIAQPASAQLDSLLLPVCESDQQIFVTKEKYKFRYQYLDSTYKAREIKPVLNTNENSQRYLKRRNVILSIAIPIFSAGATMQIVDLAGGNYNFLSPLNLAGNVVMYTGLGIAISSTRSFKLSINAFNTNVCNK